MNHQSRGLLNINTELDAAFSIVQSARSRHDLGCENARVLARRCSAETSARVRKALLGADLGESQIRLVEAKLSALIEAANRVPER